MHVEVLIRLVHDLQQRIMQLEAALEEATKKHETAEVPE